MRFKEWVKNYNPNKLALKMGCSITAVLHWINGRRVPALRYAIQIVNESNGFLDYQDLLEPKAKAVEAARLKAEKKSKTKK